MFRFLSLACALVFLLTAVPATPAGDEDKLQPVNLEKINSVADEVDPFVTPDGKLLVYATNKEKQFDLYVSVRNGTTWPAGKPYKAVNTPDADERSPFLTKGGVFYYASNAVPDPKFKNLKNFDLKWKEGSRASLPVIAISTREDEMHPWVTVNGKEFFFSRKTKDGWKLFVAKGPNPGPIKDDEEVGFPGGFHHATLSNSGLTMYLEGPLEGSRTGLFRSQRTKVGGTWSKPEPLTALNHPGGAKGDMCPSLSPDEKTLYFASDRPGGKGGLDIWAIPTAQLSPKK